MHRFRPHYQQLGQSSWPDLVLSGLAVSGRFLDGPLAGSINAGDWRAEWEHRHRARPARAGEGSGMSTDRDLDVDAIVARVLAKARAA